MVLRQIGDQRIDGRDVAIAGLHGRKQRAQSSDGFVTLHLRFRPQRFEIVTDGARSGDVIGREGESDYACLGTHDGPSNEKTPPKRGRDGYNLAITREL